MAKSNKREPAADDDTRLEVLRRELGFDELSSEDCFRELFGDAFDLPPRSATAGRVTQTGPGRRSRPRPRRKPPHVNPNPEEK